MNKWILVLVCLFILGCTQAPATNNTQLANPAAVYCEEQGGTYDIREENGQAGYCVFPDGSECPGWEYYNDECSPGDSLE